MIGITCGTASLARQTPRFGVNQAYVRALADAGATCVLIPPGSREDAAAILERIDGLVVPGGADVDPALYGEKPGVHLEEVDQPRDALEVSLVKAAARRSLPVFGICRGMQVLNVAHGGTLYQDLRAEQATGVRHKTPKTWGRSFLAHPVDIEPDSWFAEATRSRRLDVNSLHHQGVRTLGRGLVPTAVSPDGVIEALESRDRRVVAVQCHPEEVTSLRWARDLFRAFVASTRD